MQYLIDLSIIMSGKYTVFHINQVRYNIVYIKKIIVDKHVCILMQVYAILGCTKHCFIIKWN